jgi:hypothetical protein
MTSPIAAFGGRSRPKPIHGGRTCINGAAWMSALVLGSCLFSLSCVAQDPTDADIARAVRLVRQAERALVPPMATTAAATVTVEEASTSDRVAAARRLLGPSGQGTLNARIADEFAKQEAQELLWGLKFGAGVSVSSSGRKNAIREVTLDANRIVRVTKEDTNSVGYLLEAHYFLTPDFAFLGIEKLSKGNWGIGPFVAVQAGSDKALSGIGFGLMLGFRQLITDPAPISGLSWNIGVGALYDPSVKVLGAGIVADQPLPAGETAVRTTEVGSWGLLVLTSFNF